ncbi:hypothetical protein Tco_1013160, partial [Tanacetum coccineum]
DSPFHLEAFSDSDYAGDNHNRRSTLGGCQYLGRRLVSWKGLKGQKEAKTIKNRQRNERDKSRVKNEAKDQSRISPIQQERKLSEVPRTNLDKKSDLHKLI